MLDREAILTATEDALRRYGPAKATVLDVARELKVSHAAVYRYFPSKAALREAVTRRWLARAHDDLTEIAASAEPAPQRLRHWLTAIFAVKRAAATDDPELFATYGVLAAENSDAAAEHVADLLSQLQGIVADGVSSGAFAVTDVAAAARAVFDATTPFHHPAHADTWNQPDAEARLDAVCTLIDAGLRVRRPG
ncbi:MAG: TetR family transcriptional regulator [Micropruina sp.]|uniref:TetR/AcrR family transcriptional regulator n=1 Tax=Micropruina sp. TaxID=2737536 RepID=UPI0039E59CF6